MSAKGQKRLISNGFQRPISVPIDGIIEPVITPKKFAADNKSWSTKNIQSPRLAGVVVIRASNGFGICGFYDPNRILANFAQAFSEIGVSADLFAFYKPTSIACSYVVRTPAFHFSENC